MRPTVKLGEVCDVISGQSPESKYYNDKGEGLPFFQGKTEFTEKYIGTPKTWTKYTTKESIKNDILMSVRAPVGPVNINGFDKICIGRGLCAIRPSSKVELDYLFNFLLSIQEQLTGNRGSVFASINRSQIENIQIPLPPLETQKVIVARLDQIFAELDQTKSEIQKNLDNTDELWKSALNQAFQGDWEVKKLGEMAEIQNGGTPKTEKKEYWDGDILWITPKDMGELNSRYVDDTSRKISNLGLSNSSAKLLPIKSVILSSRAPIGYVAINTKPISTNQGCKGIIPNDNLKAEYLYYFLILSNKLLNSLGSGATFKELSSSKLGEVKLPVPPLSEQEKIVEHLDQVSKEVKELKSQYQSQLDNLEELKKSVLDKAFRGEMG